MDSAIAALLMLTVLIFAMLTLSHGYLVSQDELLVEEMVMQERLLERANVGLDIVAAQTTGAGSRIELTLRNSGSTKLADFDRWDVIIEYFQAADQLRTLWLPYTEGTLGDDMWKVAGIYTDASSLTPEAFEPGILNPQEEMILEIQVSPSVALTTTNRATIGVAQGIHHSTQFSR